MADRHKPHIVLNTLKRVRGFCFLKVFQSEFVVSTSLGRGTVLTCRTTSPQLLVLAKVESACNGDDQDAFLD